MDFVHSVTTWLDRNRYKALAVGLVITLLLYGIGCQAKTASLKDPAHKVDLVVFQREAAQEAAGLTEQKAQALAAVEAYNAKAAALAASIEAGMDDLAQQERIKAELFELAGGLITQAVDGQITTPGIIGTAIAALGLVGGVGAMADSRRKDAIIAEQKAKLAKMPTISANTT